MQDQLFILLLVMGGAALIPFFARRFRLPSAALEIMYGFILFNFFVSDRPEWFELFSEWGLIYLMFIVGMELDLRRFLKEKNFAWYIIIPLLSLIITPVVFSGLGYPFFLGIAVAMISAGIIIPVLRETEVIDSPVGRDIIGIALTGELLSILVLMSVDIYHEYGFTLRAGMESVKLVILTALAALFLRVLYIFAWWNPRSVEKVMESEDPVEEGIRMVLFIAFSGALAAQFSGVEPILGSFLMGLVFSYVFRSKGRFEDKINALGFGFMTPFFFIGVGADLDMNVLKSPQNLILAFMLTLAVGASNIFPLLFSPFMHIKARDAAGMTFIFSAPLSLMVVAGTLGVRMDLIAPGLRDAIVLSAIISSILYPSLFRPVARRMYDELRAGEDTQKEG